MSYQNAKLMNLEDGQKLLEAIDQHKAEIGTVAKDWEDHKTEAFAVGEYVIKDNVTYRFKAAHVANTAWNASEVEATNLGAEITGLKSAKADVIDVTLDTPAAIMSFSDGADGQPMKLEVAIDPVQDLHGYDYPWPAGGGKNLLDPSEYERGTIASDGSIDYRANRATTGFIPITGGNTYIFSAYETGWYFAGCRSYNSNKEPIEASNILDHVLTTDNNAAYIRGIIRRSDGVNFVLTDIPNTQCELGSTATDYAPYTNICPISGWTGAKVTRTGKNLYNPNVTYVTGKYLFTNDTVATQAGYQYTQDYIEVEPETTYAFQLNKTSSSTAALYVNFDDENKAYLNRVKITDGMSDTGVLSGIFTTPANCKYVRFSLPYGTPDNGITDIQLEKNSSVTAYEPFGQTYSIAFPSEAGTVYGGTLTVNKDGSGSLVVDSIFKEFDGTEGTEIIYQISSSETVRIDSSAFDNKTIRNVRSSDIINSDHIASNMLKKKLASAWSSAAASYFSFGAIQNSAWFKINDSTFSDAQSVLTWMAQMKALGTPLQLMYELVTPESFNLTASQVKSLLGLNNVWADTGNINSVEYAADTKLYIDGKIADAIANILNA